MSVFVRHNLIRHSNLLPHNLAVYLSVAHTLALFTISRSECQHYHRTQNQNSFNSRNFNKHFHPSSFSTTVRKQNRWKTSLANWHFAHFWMRQASQFYFHLVWYFCDTLTTTCHSILNKFYYKNFYTFLKGTERVSERERKKNLKRRTSRYRSRKRQKKWNSFTVMQIVVLRKISQFVWFMFSRERERDQISFNKVCIISICIRQLTILWRWILF